MPQEIAERSSVKVNVIKLLAELKSKDLIELINPKARRVDCTD